MTEDGIKIASENVSRIAEAVHTSINEVWKNKQVRLLTGLYKGRVATVEHAKVERVAGRFQAMVFVKIYKLNGPGILWDKRDARRFYRMHEVELIG